MKITFIGATEEVTGSKTLIEFENEKILIDCGMYQEEATTSAMNSENFPFKCSGLSAVIITHAHLDHTGLLPILYKNGFRGPIYLTLPTSKLARIILEDSAKLMKDEEKPLYDTEDALKVISLFKPQLTNEAFKHKNFSIKFHKASHILGASFVEIHAGIKTITFSGDLGRYDDSLLGPPDKLNKTNFLVMESTYGNKIRNSNDQKEELKKLIERIKLENKTLLIPSFALHRAQVLSLFIEKIFLENPELKVPVHFNSPMMEQVTFAYKKFLNDFIEPQESLKEAWGNLKFLDHFWDIEKVNQNKTAQIVIASSGMVTGGRIWSHLLTMASREDVIIFLPGFQAKDTTGYQLINGEKNIKAPTGEEVLVKCEIIHSNSFSSHGDQNDLIKWVQSSHNLPEQIFLVHGEPESKEIFAEKLKLLGYNVKVPNHLQSFEL